MSTRATHRRYSSRLPRTVGNPLFPVNYIDRECRKDMAEYVRETIRFARSAHNFFKPWSLNGGGADRRHTALFFYPAGDVLSPGDYRAILEDMAPDV